MNTCFSPLKFFKALKSHATQLVMCSILAMPLGSSYGQSTIYSDNSVYFSWQNSTYWYGYFTSDFGNVYGYSDEEKDRHQITNGVLGVKLLKDLVGQSGGTICDVLIDNGTDYIIKYKVKFESGFDWKKGGKLPGIGGGQIYAGGQDTSPGDGWSFRIVWHTYDNINNGQPFLAPYAYYVDQPGVYGDEFSTRYFITDDNWYDIWIHVKMNTDDNYDGKLQVKINDSTIYYNATFRWVTQNSGREIDQIMWDIFRGGDATSDYISSNDCWIYLDDFVIDKQ
ncbi:polysaccharide lyase [Cerasicoccus maritimus]|uniref:polysaccharide lyase n=1 Tax=Cerasicoccus maritimus TaxID=490089 RepID=UPI00285299BC|nr:hypothetical protein [Cerasicoccus maritimus]